MKAAVVLGTRPEIIKMASVIKELRERDVDFFIIHTGQHYSYNLDKVFFEQLKLPKSKHNLEVPGRMLNRLERCLLVWKRFCRQKILTSF